MSASSSGIRGGGSSWSVDGKPVQGQFRNEVRHVDGTGLSLEQALDRGQRFTMALIEHGFPENNDFWRE